MTKHYHLGGDIYDFEQTVYVTREQDKKLIEYISQSNNNKLAAIIGCRQTGKTSLVRRLMDQLPQNQWHTIFFDLRDYESRNTATAKALPLFVRKLCTKLLKSLAEPINLDEKTNQIETQLHQTKLDDISAWYHQLTDDDLISVYDEIDHILSQTLIYLQQHSDKKTLITLDEFEGISLVADDYEKFLTFIGRYISDPRFANIHWLCTCLYRPSYAFRDLQPSKFPITEFFLNEFDMTKTTIAQWGEGLTHLSSLQLVKLVQYTLQQTGGQPYLTAKVLDKIKLEQKNTVADVDDMIQSLLAEGDPHFDTCLMIIKADHKLALRAIYAAIDLYIYENPIIDHGVELVLLSSGLVKEASDKRSLIVKCPIYQLFYHQQWFKKAITECSMNVIPEPSIQHKNKKKLLLINAGGTMGMEVSIEDGTVHEYTNNQAWLRHFPRVNELAVIDYQEIFPPTDGANIGIEEWLKIANTIYEHRKQVEGVVIVHGTDTLAYTASAVAFSLGDSLPFPVVFTGSQAPYNIAHADAEINLLRACMVANLAETLPEVVICFNDEVYRGVRAQKHNDFRFSGFHSPSFPPLARIGQSIKLNDFDLIKRHSDSPAAPTATQWQLNNHFETRVFRVSQFPGLSQKDLFLLLDHSDIKGFVIESLGIGNLPTNNNEYFLNHFIRKASDKGVPVLISSKLPIAPEFLPLYSAASGPIQSGAIPTGNMTPSAALTKFMWLLAKYKKTDFDSPAAFISQIKQALLHPMVGEVDIFEIEKTAQG